MKRNDLVLRVHTHISQKLPSDLESKIKNFRDEVSNIHKNSDYPFEYIRNMDETPMYLDLVPNKVVDKIRPAPKRIVSQRLCVILQLENSCLHL